MNPNPYDYLVKFPNNFQLSDLFAFASSHGFEVRYVPTDPTRRQHPRQYEAVPVERSEPAEGRVETINLGGSTRGYE